MGRPIEEPIVIAAAIPVVANAGTAMALGAMCGARPVTICSHSESAHAWDSPAAIP
jgi:hypothetical protein